MQTLFGPSPFKTLVSSRCSFPRVVSYQAVRAGNPPPAPTRTGPSISSLFFFLMRICFSFLSSSVLGTAGRAGRALASHRPRSGTEPLTDHVVKRRSTIQGLPSSPPTSFSNMAALSFSRETSRCDTPILLPFHKHKKTRDLHRAMFFWDCECVPALLSSYGPAPFCFLALWTFLLSDSTSAYSGTRSFSRPTASCGLH